ncbi:hypothetical protein ACJRO7_015017 [Eucalyptus globulus]|uniref:Uncharacterized protein n=1 Tax=Eucalyptus globulus TaxID=34317 RepID=A0ABD3L269_EUCGL
MDLLARGREDCWASRAENTALAGDVDAARKTWRRWAGFAGVTHEAASARKFTSERERQRGQREQLAGSSLRWPRVGVNTAAASDAWAIHPMEDAAA